MSNHDVAVGVSNKVYNINPSSLKPSYLIYLSEGKAIKYFLTQDKPDFQNTFVIAKGIFCSKSEDEIISSFQEIFSQDKNIVEIYFPWHRIFQIKNLVFRPKLK